MLDGASWRQRGFPQFTYKDDFLEENYSVMGSEPRHQDVQGRAAAGTGGPRPAFTRFANAEGVRNLAHPTI